MNNKNIVRTARLGLSVVDLLQKCMIVAMAFFVFSFALFLFVWKTGEPVSNAMISLGSISLYLSEKAAANNPMQTPVALMQTASAFAMTGVVYYGLSIFKGILRPMTEGRPFDTSVSGRIRKLSAVVLVGGFIHYITELAAGHMFKNNYELLGSLFKEGTVESISINYRAGLGFIIAALILYILSYVFQYGEESH